MLISCPNNNLITWILFAEWNSSHFTIIIDNSKMAFILGVGCKISDTRGPIRMKLCGCIELTLRLCNVIFSTSVSDFKPEVGQFFANRKFQSSKPEVEKYLIGKLVIFCNERPIFVFWFFNPGSHQNHFYPGMSIYLYIGSKIFQKSLAPSLFKISPNWDFTYDLKFDPLSIWNISDFRFRNFELPVYEKTAHIRFGNLTLHQFRVRPIHSQSFMQIGPLVSE